MRIFTFKVLLVFFTICSTVFADCEIVDDSKSKSYNLFEESQYLYSNKEYSSAYETLLQSFQTYKERLPEIELNYACVNYIPGPYAPTIQRSSKTEIFDFDRNKLGKMIKRQLSPAPYVFIQFQDSQTIVSAINSVKTSRNVLKRRLPLENFRVSVDGEEFNFETLKVGELATKTTTKSFRYIPNITTAEDFGFKLYK